ncbi:MAG: hypothetical protein ACLT4C_04615 [Butyricicoccus sp.]
MAFTDWTQKMVENHYDSSLLAQHIASGTFSSDVSRIATQIMPPRRIQTIPTRLPLKDVAVAKIGDTYYRALADAYAALPRNAGTDSEPTTITVLKDSEGSNW